jgi:UDPglucose 6-dehydrogenase
MKKIKNKKSKKPAMGIAGLGYVGEAVKYWLEKEKHPLFLYDKYKKIGSFQEINKADIIFLCLPTPFVEKNNKGFDDSALWEVLSQLRGEKVIVIKSTVLPGSTENYQKNFSQHKILINPEFLVAKTAIQDFLNPKRQIIGYTKESQDIAKKVMNILPPATYKKIVRATEAEMIKYFGNTFLANRVIFANQIYDICQKLGIDYEVVKECAGADPRIGHSHFEIFHEGYRGYGGMCLPKDTKAFIKFVEKIGIEPKLFKTIEEINKILRKNSEQNNNG